MLYKLLCLFLCHELLLLRRSFHKMLFLALQVRHALELSHFHIQIVQDSVLGAHSLDASRRVIAIYHCDLRGAWLAVKHRWEELIWGVLVDLGTNIDAWDLFVDLGESDERLLCVLLASTIHIARPQAALSLLRLYYRHVVPVFG